MVKMMKCLIVVMRIMVNDGGKNGRKLKNH